MTDTYTLTNTLERRHQRASFDTKTYLDPTPPKYLGDALFQERYILEGRVRTSFWANKAQLSSAQAAAMRELRHFLYKDFLDDLFAMERAVEEMDQEELRRICMSMRDTVRGANQ